MSGYEKSRVLVLIISKYVLKIILALLVQLLPLQLANNVGDVHWLHKCVCVFEYLEKAKKITLQIMYNTAWFIEIPPTRLADSENQGLKKVPTAPRFPCLPPVERFLLPKECPPG